MVSRRLAPLLALLGALALGACGHTGYVESDLPGVAEYLGRNAIEHNASRQCPAGWGHEAIGRYERSGGTRPLDLKRRRVSFAFRCVPPPVTESTKKHTQPKRVPLAPPPRRKEEEPALERQLDIPMS